MLYKPVAMSLPADTHTHTHTDNILRSGTNTDHIQSDIQQQS